MLPQPLIEFANFRASSNVGAYGEVYGPRRVVDRWIKQSIRRGKLSLPLPPGVVKAHDAFLAREGRASRRLIDIPDPAGDEGLTELNSLIDRVVASRHEASLLALLASLEVDLDWIRESNEAWRDAKRSRVQHRFERAIERVVAALQGASEASILLYRPTLEPIVVAAQAVSDELLAYIVRNPSTLQELRPRQFEELIAHVLERFGWEVELTPETRDGGYDILAVSKDVDGSQLRTSYIVECKKYRSDRKVGISVVRELLQVKAEKSASHAVIATTSDFTSGVYDFAAKRLDLDAKNAKQVIQWCKGALKR